MKKEKNILLIGPKRKHLELLRAIKVLKETIAWFKKRIEPHDCGWMYTTIDGLKYRIKELRKEKRAN